MPTAPAALRRNISALLTQLIKDGKMHLDFDEEITAGTVITHEGKVVHPATAELLAPAQGSQA
jgi:NAD(P) transhydrogenase subunit alpha